VRSRLILLGALSATAALLTAGCSSSSGTGPLGGSGGQAIECFPAPRDHTVTQGFYVLQNGGKTDVTVRSVRLVKPRGIVMATKAWVVPPWYSKGSQNALGVGYPYPPVTWPTWKDRRPAVGAVVKPNETLNLVFGVARTATKGTSAAPVVTYTAGGNTYTWQQGTTFVMVARNCS